MIYWAEVIPNNLQLHPNYCIRVLVRAQWTFAFKVKVVPYHSTKTHFKCLVFYFEG